MAYDSRIHEVSGVAALDPTVAAYKKFIKERLGQPDLIQFLQSEQGKRMDPNLAGAMLVLDKLEKARENAPKGPAPTTNVVQDLGLAAAQEAQRERMAMARERGIAQLPNPAMAGAQFQGGIAQTPQMAEGGIAQLAGGGPIAFDDGGLAGIDFSKMTEEQLTQLSKDQRRDLAGSAARELARRKGINVRTPGELFSDIADVYRQSWKAPEGMFPLVRFSNERKFPSYMYDEQGNVRKGEVTGGIAGTPFYSSSNPQSVTPAPAAAASAQAVAPSSIASPTDVARGLTGGEGFDAFMAAQGLGADRSRTGATTGAGTPAPAPAARGPGMLSMSDFSAKKPQEEKALREARIARQQQDKTGEYAESIAQERQWIADRQKEYGEDKATATKNFWIMTGASLLGSRSPFFTNALGDALKENYGNLIGDLRQLKKDQRALDLQKINLTRAVETARETGSKEDRAEAIRQQTVYDNIKLEVLKTNANIANSAANRDIELQIARIKSENKEPTRKLAALVAIQKNLLSRKKDIQYTGSAADKKFLDSQLDRINLEIGKEGGVGGDVLSGGGSGVVDWNSL